MFLLRNIILKLVNKFLGMLSMGEFWDTLSLRECTVPRVHGGGGRGSALSIVVPTRATSKKQGNSQRMLLLCLFPSWATNFHQVWENEELEK